MRVVKLYHPCAKLFSTETILQYYHCSNVGVTECYANYKYANLDRQDYPDNTCYWTE